MVTVLDVAWLEGRRKPIARAIGAQAIRLNRFDSQAEHVDRAAMVNPPN